MVDYETLPLGDDAPEVVNAIIEIPKGSRNKYEYDHAMGIFMLDRVLSSPMFYAADYGFLPRTLAGDGDATDILVLMEQPTFTGCVLPCRPVGMMKMDDGGEDFKVLAVPAKDKRFDQVKALEDVQPHYLAELEHFFASYKTLEGKQPEMQGWFSAEHAKAYIIECQAAYTKANPGK